MAAQNPVEVVSQQSLSEKLSEILSTGTLYRPFAYRGRSLHHTRPSGDVGSVSFGLLPTQLKLFCSRCQADESWQLEDRDSAYYFGHDEEPERKTYWCRNCGEVRQHYWIEWLEQRSEEKDQDSGRFTKVGQWPPLSIEPSSDLSKSLGKEDARLYKKALINATISHGIGALAYFRRVIENKVNDLIDLVADAARNAQSGTEELKQIDAIKASNHVDEKIEFAKKLLPAHLQPGGHNPLDKLYGVASAGLHGESEEKCLELFAEYKLSFE